MMNKKFKSGIYNIGSGTTSTFNELAEIFLEEKLAKAIKYIPFPKEDRRPQEYQWKIYVLNISNIKDYSWGMSNNEIVPLWLNTYTTSNSQYVRDASNNKFYKIPIEKITIMSFMNWETNPLEAIR